MYTPDKTKQFIDNKTIQSVLSENTSGRLEKILEFLNKSSQSIKGLINKLMVSANKPIEYLGIFAEVANGVLFAILKVFIAFTILVVMSQEFWITLIAILKKSWADAAPGGFAVQGFYFFKVLIQSFLDVLGYTFKIALSESDLKFKSIDVNESFNILFTKMNTKLKEFDLNNSFKRLFDKKGNKIW